MKQCKYCGWHSTLLTPPKVQRKPLSVALLIGVANTRLRSFCSVKCQTNYNEIMRKISHQKEVERIMRPELTPDEEKNLRRIRDVLNNC